MGSLERSSGRYGIAGVALALTLWAAPARAQVVGDWVRIETGAEVIEGTLVDKLPDGYLVRVGDGSRVVPYGSVRSIAKLGGPAPAPARPPYVVVVPPPQPQYAPPRDVVTYRLRNPEMAGVGKSMTILGILGLVTGAILAPIGAKLRADNVCHDASGSLKFQCEYGKGTAIRNGGYISLALGGAFTVAGAVLYRIGVTPVRSTQVDDARIPSVTIASNGAGLTWTF